MNLWGSQTVVPPSPGQLHLPEEFICCPSTPLPLSSSNWKTTPWYLYLIQSIPLWWTILAPPQPGSPAASPTTPSPLRVQPPPLHCLLTPTGLILRTLIFCRTATSLLS